MSKYLKNTILLLSLVCLTTACASSEWVNRNKPGEVFFEDKLACEDTANRMAWQRYPQPGPITINKTEVNTSVQSTQTDHSTSKSERTISPEAIDPYIYNRNNYQHECLMDCLHSKGWFLQKIQQR